MPRQSQSDLIKLLIESNAKTIETLTSSMERSIKEVVEASKQSNQILQSWLDGFKQVEKPYTSVMNDNKQFAAEKADLTGMSSLAFDELQDKVLEQISKFDN